MTVRGGAPCQIAALPSKKPDRALPLLLSSNTVTLFLYGLNIPIRPQSFSAVESCNRLTHRL